MLLSEIIYNIKNLVAGGIQSDDMEISDSQIAFIVDYYRARLFKQDQEKSRFNKDLYVQNLGKVNLITTDTHECCVVTKCALRTAVQIPTPIEAINGLNLTFVGLLNGQPFTYQSYNTLPWKHADKWTSKEPTYYFQNGYIYIVNPPTDMLTYVNIQGIFESPKKAVKFRTCDCDLNGEACFDGYDFEYKLPQHYVDTIVKMVAQTELAILKQIPADTANNSMAQLVDVLKKNQIQ